MVQAPDLGLCDGIPARSGRGVASKLLRWPRRCHLSEKWAAYSATLLHQFAETHLCGDETHADRRHCRLVDVFAGQVHEAPERFKNLRKDVEAACGQIRELWKSVGMDATSRGA
ncbi:hypothetical protein [Paludisphaera borealis]|uniref:hypothetical protein n=1 Tax=Paludisphaera borealis TaxID=1387353 RepID=UPI001AEFC5C5|nr:hypothetical protein [Paludisphaera borealis]